MTLWHLILLTALLAIYLMPSIIAKSRKHRNLGAIFALNLLLGWTMLGWVGALVWAFVNPAPPQPIIINNEYRS